MSMSKKTMTGAQILWDCLVREGVNVVFGYPGGRDPAGLRRDARLSDPARARAARAGRDAHGRRLRARDGQGRRRRSRRPGPGATNMVTGIATAMMDSSPIVCITGQVGSPLIGSDAFQETDITGITLPITKHNYLVTRASDVAPAIREAFAVAASGRPGPVLVDITKDAQLGSVRVRLGAPPRRTSPRWPGPGIRAASIRWR